MERKRLEVLGWEIDTLSSSFIEDAAYLVAAFRLSEAGASFATVTGTMFDDDILLIAGSCLEPEEFEFLEELHVAIEDEVALISRTISDLSMEPEEDSEIGEMRISIPSIGYHTSRINFGLSEATISSYDIAEDSLSSFVALSITRQADAMGIRQMVTAVLSAIREEAGRAFEESTSYLAS